MHDRVEVEVESLPAGQALGQAGPVQGLEQGHLAAALQAVGVGGQGGGLGQGHQPREQRRPGVGGDVVDVGDPPGRGELERQQGEQVGAGGDLGSGWVACGTDQPGQVQGQQVGDRQQQTGQLGLRPGRKLAMPRIYGLEWPSDLAGGRGLPSRAPARQAIVQRTAANYVQQSAH